MIYRDLYTHYNEWIDILENVSPLSEMRKISKTDINCLKSGTVRSLKNNFYSIEEVFTLHIGTSILYMMSNITPNITGNFYMIKVPRSSLPSNQDDWYLDLVRNLNRETLTSFISLLSNRIKTIDTLPDNLEDYNLLVGENYDLNNFSNKIRCTIHDLTTTVKDCTKYNGIVSANELLFIEPGKIEYYPFKLSHTKHDIEFIYRFKCSDDIKIYKVIK